MNGSGRFTGIAKMTSSLRKEHFDLWALDDVWNGLIRVEWLVIKDIPNKFLKHILLPNNDNKPITNSRDTQEIQKPEALKFIQEFETFNETTTLLQHFQYFDQREHIYLKKQREMKGRTDNSGP